MQTTKTSVHGAINMLGLAKRVKARPHPRGLPDAATLPRPGGAPDPGEVLDGRDHEVVLGREVVQLGTPGDARTLGDVPDRAPHAKPRLVGPDKMQARVEERVRGRRNRDPRKRRAERRR